MEFCETLELSDASGILVVLHLEKRNVSFGQIPLQLENILVVALNVLAVLWVTVIVTLLCLENLFAGIGTKSAISPSLPPVAFLVFQDQQELKRCHHAPELLPCPRA